jgi:hypothetical protein
MTRKEIEFFKNAHADWTAKKQALFLLINFAVGGYLIAPIFAIRLYLPTIGKL